MVRPSSRRSIRSLTAGNTNPYTSCSQASQPAPIPSTARPPDMTSSAVTDLARSAGFRRDLAVEKAVVARRGGDESWSCRSQEDKRTAGGATSHERRRGEWNLPCVGTTLCWAVVGRLGQC